MYINIKETSMICPAKELAQQHLWLSNMDLIQKNLRHFFVYLYKSNNSAFHTVTKMLKDALSKVLVQFYPVAGRLTRDSKGRLHINCNGNGVLFIEAETDFTIQQLGDLLLNDRILQLAPPNSTISPLFIVQVTKFRCGGVSIGMKWHHILSDGNGYINFIKTWFDMARGLPISHPPFIDRTILHNLVTKSPKFQHIEWNHLPPINNKHLIQTDTKTEILKITSQQLNALKSKVKEEEEEEEDNNNGKTKYSSYQVLAGHIWRCTCKARGLYDDQETKFVTPVDSRSRLKPPLPKSYFGNAVLITSSLASAGDLVSEPLKKTVERISKAINRMDDEYLRSAMDYMNGFGDVRQIARGPHTSRCPNLVIPSWMNIPFYSLDFGMGKPLCFRPMNPVEGKGYILPTPSNEIDGSWALIISLEKNHMESFKKLFYNDLCSTIQMPKAKSPNIIPSKI